MSTNRATPDALRAILAKAREKLASAERELAGGFDGEASSRTYYAVFPAITAVTGDPGACLLVSRPDDRRFQP